MIPWVIYSYPSVFLYFLNFLPFKELLVKSANISYVEYCFTFNSLQIRWFLIKYNCMLICHDLLRKWSIPCFFNIILLVLSWCNVGSQSYPCCFSKFLVHNKCGKTSFAAANCLSVEIFVLIFWFIENVWIYHLPVVNTPIVLLFMSECTAKAASTYQSSMVILLIFYVISSSSVYWRYLIILNNLL